MPVLHKTAEEHFPSVLTWGADLGSINQPEKTLFTFAEHPTRLIASLQRIRQCQVTPKGGSMNTKAFNA